MTMINRIRRLVERIRYGNIEKNLDQTIREARYITRNQHPRPVSHTHHGLTTVFFQDGNGGCGFEIRKANNTVVYSERDERRGPMTDEHEHTYYGLAFPFVVCESQGGPWGDQAFVQGVNLGVLIQRMEYGEDDAATYVHPDLVRQVDLAAMHFGYTMEAEPWDEHNTLVTLVKGRHDNA